MKTSTKGIDLIKEFEGLRLQAYQCPAGKWTIGFGTTKINGQGVPQNLIISESQAKYLLQQDLIEFEKLVLQNITVQLNQNQFDALVSHTYNTGGSEILFDLINQSSPNEVIRNWMENSYITVDNKILNGLIRRRKAEADLYFSAV
jgi:lysozyme